MRERQDEIQRHSLLSHHNPLIPHEFFINHESSMQLLSFLGFCSAWEVDSAQHWQSWIFNEEQQQPWNNGVGQRPSYPYQTLTARCLLIHQTTSELSLLSALQGLHTPLLLLFPLPTLSAHFTTHISVCFLHPFTVTWVIFLWRAEYCGQRQNKPGGRRWHFYPSPK